MKDITYINKNDILQQGNNFFYTHYFKSIYDSRATESTENSKSNHFINEIMNPTIKCAEKRVWSVLSISLFCVEECHSELQRARTLPP